MKKVYLNRFILILILISSLSILFSCVESEKKGNAHPQGAVGHGEPLADKNGDEIESKTVEEKDASSEAVVSEPRGSDFLLFYEKAPEPVIAGDFDIGMLQSGFGNDEITADINKTAGAFLSSLVDGEADADLIASAKKDFVQRIVNDGLKISVPVQYRIGEINSLADPVQAEVKLFGEEGWSTGVIYFVREGGWKIYDFHLDFNELERSVDPELEDWDPANMKKW